MNSSCATLKRMCRKKYSCEDKKNAIKYLCSTVWQREGTLLYENPNNAPASYAGLQLFELPANNKHEDAECNHYVGYSLQGTPDTTNEELLAAGGTLFTTSIDGINWSRLSWVAEWNEELGHFDCKLSDLDDKSNYMFTLDMNKPTKISWRGYETNVISINPTNVADGDSGFSGAGYYIALPNKSQSDYPTYAQVYSITGWGGTPYTGNEYFEATLSTAPAQIRDERVITEDEKAQDPSLADFDTTSTLTGLERMEIQVKIDGMDYWTAVFMKWDTPISLSEENNIQTGNCTLCYVDGVTNQLESVIGVYYAKYNANRETVVEVICGPIDNPTVNMDITRDSSTNVSSIKITTLNLPISAFEPNSRNVIQIAESTLVKLGLFDGEQSTAVRSRLMDNSGWYSYPFNRLNTVGSIGPFNQGISPKIGNFTSKIALASNNTKQYSSYDSWLFLAGPSPIVGGRLRIERFDY